MQISRTKLSDLASGPLVELLRLSRNSIIYSLALGFSSVVGLVLLPITTRYLAPEDYGVFLVASSAVVLPVMLGQLGLNSALSRYYFEFIDSPALLSRYLGTITTSMILSFGVILVLMPILGEWVLQPILGNDIRFVFVGAALIIGFIKAFFSLGTRLLELREKAVKSAVTNSIYTASLPVFTLLFVVAFGLGEQGLFASALTSAIVGLVLVLSVYRENFEWSLDRQLLRPSLVMGLPMMVSQMGSWVLDSTGLLIVNRLDSTASAGLFGISMMFASAVSMVGIAVNTAWYPVYMRKIKKADFNEDRITELTSRSATYILLINCLVVLGFVFIIPPLIGKFLPAQYTGVGILAAIMAFGWLFGNMYYVAFNQLMLRKQGSAIAIVHLAAGAVQILATIVLMPHYGILGAALGFAIGRCAQLVIGCSVGSRIHITKNETARLFKVSVVFIVVAVAGLTFSTGTTLTMIIGRLLLIMTFPLLLALVRFYDSSERTLLQSLTVSLRYAIQSYRSGVH